MGSDYAMELNELAIQIAIEAGVLQRCEFHEHVVFSTGLDVSEAYKLGSAKLKAGKLGNMSQRELTDAIQSAYNDHFWEECSACEKNMED